jgi:hypothetical protein
MANARRTGEFHRCDTCRTGFDCRTLHTALTVLGAHRDRIQDPEQRMRLEAIEKVLEDAGWRYPEGGRGCRFANMPKEIQQLTSELVRIWQGLNPASLNGQRSTYQEEVHLE